MRKTLYILIFISFVLKGCMDDAEMTPRYYPVISTEVKTDSLSGSVTFYGKIEKGTDSIIEYGFAYTLKEGFYLPGNFITFSEKGYHNYSLTFNSGLLPNSEYEVRTWAKTKRFTVLGAAVDLHTHNYEPRLQDIDGNLYHTIYIGSQEWMVENLRVTRYNDGSLIPDFDNMDQDSDITTGTYVVYPYSKTFLFDNEEQVVENFGLLYNWYAVDDSRGLCPAGWRIPSDKDWMQLEGYSDSQFAPGHPEWLKNGPRGADAGFHLKSDSLWRSNSANRGRNHFGFRAFPGGYFDYNYYKEAGFFGYYWSHSAATSNDAWYRLFDAHSKPVRREAGFKQFGMSVRCMRDVIFEPDSH